MPNKMLFPLSLCRKAGALVMGFDAVKECVLGRKAHLVVCASDLSEGTRRRVDTFCQGYVQCITVAETQFELLAITKKPTGVFAITNRQLAALCRSKQEE